MSTAFSVAAPVAARATDNVRKDKLVSMLVACCGQLEYTRLCVPSLLRHSRQPLEVLFLDTGSLDGTAEYLAGIADAVPFRVEIVPVSDGAGADLQKKQDVLQVSGPFVVLLNLGAFDLAALGTRARQAGFRLGVCEEAFVYHFGARHPVRV